LTSAVALALMLATIGLAPGYAQEAHEGGINLPTSPPSAGEQRASPSAPEGAYGEVGGQLLEQMKLLEQTAATLEQIPAQTSIDLSGPWRFRGDWEESGLGQGWEKPEFNDADWRQLHVPATWEEQGIMTPNPRWPSTGANDGYNGYAWYRRHVTVPAEWGEAPVRFRSGWIDDFDWVYVNGTLVGAMTQDTVKAPRDYLIPPGVLKVGADNVIAIRVSDTGEHGGMREGPVELVNVSLSEAEVARTEAELERQYPERRNEIVNIGGGVDVPENTMVEGDVVAIGGSADVKGYVKGSVVAIGGNVHAHPRSKIDGDAVAIGGTVVKEGDAQIGGSLVNGPMFPGGLISRIIKGAVEHKGAERLLVWPFGVLRPLGRAGQFLSNLLFWAIVTAILVLLFPRRLEVMAGALPEAPGRAAAYGIGGFFVTSAGTVMAIMVGAALCVILAMTVIGIPLIPVVGIALVGLVLLLPFLALLGTVAVWLSLGRALAARTSLDEPHTIWAALLGLLIVAIVTVIPGVGSLIVVTLLIFGFGVALMTGMGANATWAGRRFGGGRKTEQAAQAAEPEAPAQTGDVAEGQEPSADEPSEH
jgi:hypothetical protein